MARHSFARRQAGGCCGRYMFVRRSLAVLLALVAQVTVLSAESPVPALADVSITLDGHGNGHGYGLSQWGAYGYAVDYGWSAAQILDHYYGATAPGTVALDTTIAVRLMNLDDAQTAVVSGTGGLMVDGVAGGPWLSVLAREVSPSVYAVWARADAQVCPASTDDPVSTGWTLVAASVVSQVTIRTQANSTTTVTPSDLAAVCQPNGMLRSYRGLIRAVQGSAGENRTVNEVPVEQYLRSVVAKEVSPGWATAGGGRGAQALQAQAVAARSFGLAEARYSYAKTCDLTCQYYLGAASRTSLTASYVAVEHPATDAAVLATAGMVRRLDSNGNIALTMFAASSGGWTKPGPTALVPFPAVTDEGDATTSNPTYNWSVSLSGSAIAAKYPAVGTFASVTVLTRNGYGDWGGRVNTVRIAGSAGEVTITGDQFRSAFGLKSDWFNVRGSTPIDPCSGRNAPAIGPVRPAAAAARYSAVTPVRLIDTRTGVGTSAQQLLGGCTLVVDPGVEASVTAVAVNLTSVAPAATGYLTVYPCGVERPVASVVQATAQRTIAGATVVPLGADGTFCVYTSAATHLLVDLFGSYSASSGQKFEPVSPTRVLDSRAGGSRLAAGAIVTIAVAGTATVPAGATAAALSVQAIDPTGAGYLTVFPCSQSVPVVSSLNVVAAGNIANHVEVALSAAGTVCVYVSAAMHIIVDLSGWYGAGATSEFHALTPVRALDTRNNIGLNGPFAPLVDRSLMLAGTNGLPAATKLRAVVGEVTAVGPGAVGYLTVHPCQPVVPQVSMVQTWAGANAASVVIGADDDLGRWCILTSTSMHVLLDVSGYFS